MVDMINFFCVVKFFASAPAASRGERRKAEQALVCEVVNSRIAEGEKSLNYLLILSIGNTPFFSPIYRQI